MSEEFLVRKWFIRLGILFLIFMIVFLGLHAIIPAGKEHSEYTPQNDVSPWNRIQAISGEPTSIFDGTRPISDPWVMHDDGIYKMWFTLALEPFTPKQRIGIAYAESSDGLNWKCDGKQVLSPRAGQWDSLSIETACVVKVAEDAYLLYYTAPEAPEGNHHFRIGVASSIDGKIWTRVGNGPVLEGINEWEKPFRDGSSGALIGGVLEPCVQFDKENGTYRMWYVGLGKVGDDFPKYRIGYVSSIDGNVWQRQSQPVLEPSGAGGWDDAINSHVDVTIDPQGTHHLFYFGSSASQYSECESLGGCAMTPGAIGYATSDDGIVWQKWVTPILSPQTSGWDSWAIGGPSVLREVNGFRMWYFGNQQHNSYKSRIGIAEW
jgi:predicted GH43/DUF377 family glycosyl hydrolase